MLPCLVRRHHSHDPDPVAEYNYQQAKFKDISGQVSNILSSLKKVEKSVEGTCIVFIFSFLVSDHALGIIPSFTRLSQSLNTFYEDDPYTRKFPP